MSLCSPDMFTGKERDGESQLDYFGARYYGSALGRFTSPDWSAKPQPIPFAKPENPQSLNLYAYMLDNPLRGVDPDGHDGCPQGQPGCKSGTQTTTTGDRLAPTDKNHEAADKNPAKLVVVNQSGGPKGGEIDYSLQDGSGKPLDGYVVVQAETKESRASTTQFGPGTSTGVGGYFPDNLQPGLTMEGATKSIQTFYMVPVGNDQTTPTGPPQPVNVVDSDKNVFYALGAYMSQSGQVFVNGQTVVSPTFLPPPKTNPQ